MDEETQQLVTELSRSKKTLHKIIAKHLVKPRRQRISVNVGKLERVGNANEALVVPGKVLATGAVSKAFHVYALMFSHEAQTKITQAGGSCAPLHELLKKQIAARLIL
ncbi:MAG: 50S ribosomal protein L18e [Candidatus Aenigmarchaeota archaeon]|nr:50S ribosomal protein L18e [Candidatus Aenigmarchaeota archaeon]